MAINIHHAQAEDFPAAHELIKELALFEKAPEQVENSLEQFIKDGTSEHPLYKLLVAKTDTIQPKVVGIALYYIGYSTWKGKMLYLDDLVITESYRRQGIGQQLVDALFLCAQELGVHQVRWQVLNWNEPAIQFYRKLKMNLDADWINCYFSEQQLTDYLKKKNV